MKKKLNQNYGLSNAILVQPKPNEKTKMDLDLARILNTKL